jgi:hypothetical protein
MRKSTQYIAKKATSDASFHREHTVHMKVFIPHIYGLLNTKLQHMVSFFTIFAKPGSSANKKNFNKKTIGLSFLWMMTGPPFPAAQRDDPAHWMLRKRENGESTIDEKERSRQWRKHSSRHCRVHRAQKSNTSL